MSTIARGVVVSYNAADHSASVRFVQGLATPITVPVSDGIAALDVVAGRECGVIFFTDDNPQDAAVETVHNAVPTGDLQASGQIRAGGTPATDTAPYFIVTQNNATQEGRVGVKVDLGGTLGFLSTGVYGVGGHVYARADTTTDVVGLDFGVGLSSLSNATIEAITAIRTSFAASGIVTSTVTNARGLHLGGSGYMFGSGSNLTITTFTHIEIAGSTSVRATNVIGFKMNSWSGAGITVTPLDLAGPARTTNTDGSMHRMNLQLFSMTRSFGTGDGVLGIAYATTNPTTSPAGGVIVWASSVSGDTRFKGASGQICSLPTGGAPNVTGSRGGNAALASLLTTLAGMGHILDGTTV